MKRLTLIIFTLILAASLILSGCSNNASSTPATSSAPAATNSTTAANTSANTSTAATTSAPANTSAPAVSTTAAAGTPQSGGILRYIMLEGPSGSIGVPANMRGLSSMLYAPHMLESLFDYQSTGEYIPCLATDYKWSSDDKTVTINLRKGVKFTDGSDFNASIFKWNWDQATAAKASGTDNVASIETPDDYTVKVTIKRYENTWFRWLATAMMASKAAIEKNGVEYVNWHPVGTGPFVFKDYKENNFLELVRNENYWGDKPYLDGVKFMIIADPVTAQISFEAGEGDVLNVVGRGHQLAHDLTPKGYNVCVSPGLNMTLIPSSGNPQSPLSNQKVREAIEYAIDKAQLAKTVGLNYFEPRYQDILSSQQPFDPNYQGRRFDKEKAKALLAEAGYPTGFKTKLICGQHLAGDELPAVQANLKAIGIEASIELITVAKWIEYETNGWDEGLLESPHSPWPFGDFLNIYYHKPDQPNWGKGDYWTALYRPDALEPMIQQYLVLSDPAQQKAKAIEIMKFITDQCMTIPLYETKDAWVLQPNIHDMFLGKVNPGADYNYTKTWIGKK